MKKILKIQNNLKNLTNELGCDYSVEMAGDCLSSHCQDVHGWRSIPCPHDYCKYEAFSETSHKACDSYVK